MPSKKSTKHAKTNKQRVMYVKLASINDLARFACHFSQHNKTLFTSELENKKVVFTFAEHIEDTRIAYFANQDKYHPVISYTNGEDKPERVEALDKIDAVAKTDTYYFNVVEIGTNGFKAVSKIKPEDLDIVAVKKYEDTVKAIIKKSMDRGEWEHAYVLDYKGKCYLVGFDIFEELLHGSTMLYYSELKSRPTASFARYNYASDEVDFSNDFGEHAYIYVKLIYLAQPFDFFKV